MDFYSWRLSPLLARLGVKPARGMSASNFVQPVLVMGDISALGGQPQPRQFGTLGVIPALAANFSFAQILSGVGYTMTVRNFGGTLLVGTQSLGTTPNAAMPFAFVPRLTYRKPGDDDTIPLQILGGQGPAVPDAGQFCFAVPTGGVPTFVRVSPGVRITLSSGVLFSAVSFGVQFDQFEAIEEQG